MAWSLATNMENSVPQNNEMPLTRPARLETAALAADLSVGRINGDANMRLLDSLRRSALTLLIRQPIPRPTPDEHTTPVFAGQTIVELRYSLHRNYRVVITEDSAGRFRVHRQWWDASDWDVASSAYWADDDDGAVIADTLERAQGLATEALHARDDS